tara:strand:- start:42 stop:293 length:252 start_codon:yes stop_codon:yes gene_type:complete
MSSPFQKQFSAKSPLDQKGPKKEPKKPSPGVGTFGPTERTEEEKAKAKKIAKKNKNKPDKKLPPCPEGKKRVFGFGGASCVDK